jgi:NADPH:quinone reductase
MRAIQQREFGGPEVLELADLPVPEPGPGEVLVEVRRAGLNFADTHQRRNEYLAARELPFVPGSEVAGVLAGTGERVVALCGTGGYAEWAVAPADRTVPLPDEVDDGTALALLIQGLTAWHLLRTAGRVAPGESVVIISAAGGTGSLATQLARPMGAGRVIATASSPEKRELALALGADAALDGDADGLEARLLEANGGRPVDVVLEMAGGPVLDACFAALAPFGRLVTYGIASGEGNRLHTRKLMAKSASLVGFWLFDALARDPEWGFRAPLADLFARAARGEVRAVVGGTYPLAEARRAQEDLAARRTSGKLLLDPTA